MNLKKILALVLVLTMVLSFIPTYAFAEDDGIELVEEEEVQDIVEVQEEPEEEPAAEPVKEETPAEPVEEEVPEEEPAPTEEEPAEEPEEEEEEVEGVTSTVEDTETLEANITVAKIGDDTYPTLQEAINECAVNSTIELVKDVTENIEIGKAVTINAVGKTITGTVSVTTTTDVAFTATINGATITGAVTVTGNDETHAATLTLNNVTLGENSTLTLSGEFAAATLNDVTMIASGDCIDAGDGWLAITGGTFGTVTGKALGDVEGGTFGKIDKILIAPGYTTDTFSTTYADYTWCKGTVTETTDRALLVATATNGIKAKYYEKATDAFKATLATSGTFANSYVYLMAPYNEETFELADDQELYVVKNSDGTGLVNGLKAKTDGHTIASQEVGGLIRYYVNPGYQASIGTTGYVTFTAAFEARESDDDVIVLLATPTDATKSLTMAKNKYVKVDLGKTDVTIATITDLFADLPTGYSYNVTMDENKVYTITHVSNNFEVAYDNTKQYFSDLNLAIASVPTNTSATVTVMETTNITSPVTIAEGQGIDLKLGGKRVTLQSAINVAEGAVFTITASGTESFLMETSSATITIADGAQVKIYAPVVAQDIAKLATISGNGRLYLVGNVNLNRAVDGITAEAASVITIGEEATDKFTATLTGTGTAFKGGIYTINGAVDIDNAGVGFENVTADVNAKVEIEATVIGVKNSNLTIVKDGPATRGELDPGNGFDLLAANTITTKGTDAKLATTTGLTARIEDFHVDPVKISYFSKFATAASKVEYTGTEEHNTVYLIKAPDEGDVYEFTKADGKLDVKADAGVEIANYSDLVEAFKDDDKPTKAIVDAVGTNDVHTLSQAEFSVSLIEKDSGKVVKNFTNFTEALKSAYADTQYYLIVDSAAAIAGVNIPATMPKIYLKAGVGVTAENLQGAIAPEHMQFKKGTNDAVPYLDNDGYYVYELADALIPLTWNANGGQWGTGDTATKTKLTEVKANTAIETVEAPTQSGKFFAGWTIGDNTAIATDGDLKKGVTTATTLTAQWKVPTATLTDLGGYGYNFETVENAYAFLNDPEHADWFNETSVITLVGNAGTVYLDDFVPAGESLKLKKGTFTADVKLRNQIEPTVTSTTPYESDTYKFVVESEKDGVTTYSVGQYTAQLETVVSESTKGNNGTWSDFQVTSTSYEIIKDSSVLSANLAGYVTKSDDETDPQKKTRTVKTIIFLADNPATSTNLNDDLFTATGTSLRVNPNGHADNFKIPTSEFITKTPESGIDVYTRTTFTVTLDGNGGTPATQVVTPVRAEEKVTTWTNVTKHGYTWTAWATSTDTAAAVIKPAETSITKDQTWYAKWDPVDVTYTFVATATEFNVTTQTKISGKFGTEVGTGTNLAAINGVKTYMADKGFTVTGWTLDGETVEQPTTFTYTGTNTNLTYVATLEPITFQVTLNGNGGTPDIQTQTVKKAVGHVSTATNVYTEPTKENYKLLGWTTDSNLATSTDKQNFKDVTAIDIATDTTLYAGWEGVPVTYKFKYSLPASPTNINRLMTISGKYGDALTTTTDLPDIKAFKEDLNSKGYEWVSWTLNGEEVTSDPTTFVGTATNIYTANVKEKTFTITFDGNGGLINGKEEFTVTGKANDKIEVSLATTSDVGIKAIKGNYKHTGWTLDTNSNVATTTDIKGKTFLEVKDATYYATYAAGTVVLTFNDPASNWTNVMKVTTGATATDIKNESAYATPTRLGYTFNDWSPELATADVDATYSAQWLKVMDVAIVAGDYTIETLTGIVEGQKINADPTITNVKIGGKPVRWLINGTDGRFFTFGETAVPVDLTSLVATATVPEAGKITVTWTNNNGTEVLATETKDAPYEPSWTGAEPTFADPVAGKLYKFMGWQVGTGTDVYNNTADTINNVKAFSTLGLTEDTTIKAYFKESPHDEVYQRSLSLTDSIAIKWRIAQVATGADASKYSAVVTFKGESTTYTSGLTSGITIARCAAKEMTELATVTVFYDGAEIATLNYSVNDYCDEMIAKEAETGATRWTALMHATQDYGYYAQKNYNYNTGKLPTGGGTALNPAAAVPTTSSAVKSANTTIGISAVQFRLITEAETILSVAFKKDSGSTKTAADYVFTVNGTTVPTENIVEANGLLEVRVGGIAAKNLGDTVKVYCASKDEPNKRAVFEGSPVDYMATATSSTKTSQELKNMVKGMYNYHLEAKNALIAQ